MTLLEYTASLEDKGFSAEQKIEMINTWKAANQPSEEVTEVVDITEPVAKTDGVVAGDVPATSEKVSTSGDGKSPSPSDNEDFKPTKHYNALGIESDAYKANYDNKVAYDKEIAKLSKVAAKDEAIDGLQWGIDVDGRLQYSIEGEVIEAEEDIIRSQIKLGHRQDGLTLKKFNKINDDFKEFTKVAKPGEVFKNNDKDFEYKYEVSEGGKGKYYTRAIDSDDEWKLSKGVAEASIASIFGHNDFDIDKHLARGYKVNDRSLGLAPPNAWDNKENESRNYEWFMSNPREIRHGENAADYSKRMKETLPSMTDISEMGFYAKGNALSGYSISETTGKKRSLANESVLDKDLIKVAGDIIINEDLDIEFANNYYNQDNNNDFVAKYYDAESLEKINVNIKDFQGWLNKNGFSEDFEGDVDGGVYNILDPKGKTGEMANETLSTNKERRLAMMLDTYMGEQNTRLNRKSILNDIIEGKKGVDLKTLSKTNEYKYTNFDSGLVDKYISKQFPILATKEAEYRAARIAEAERRKARRQSQMAVAGSAGIYGDLANGVWDAAEGVGRGVLKVPGGAYGGFMDTLTFIKDMTGADIYAKRDRALNWERSVKDTNLDYFYVKGKGVEMGGEKYIRDAEGTIYNVTSGYVVGDTLSALQSKKLNEKINKEGVAMDDYNFIGGAKQMGDITGNILFQVIGAKGMGAGRALVSSRVLAAANGYKSVAKYKKMITLKKGLDAATGYTPKGVFGVMKPQVVDNMMFQSFYGASIGHNNTIDAAKKAGLSDDDADQLANIAMLEMGALYAVTGPMNSRIPLLDKIDDWMKKSGAINSLVGSYSKTGSVGVASKAFKSRIKDYAIKAKDFGITFGKGGIAETIQENTQQKGEFEIVNANTNERAGFDLMKSKYTEQDFVNTSILSFAAGGLLTGSSRIKGGYKANQFKRLENLLYVGNDLKGGKARLDKMVLNGKATVAQVDAIMFDAEAAASHVNEMPAWLMSRTPEAFIEAARISQQIKNLQSDKKNFIPAFTEGIEAKIDAKILALETVVKKAAEKLVLDEASTIKKILDKKETAVENGIGKGERVEVFKTTAEVIAADPDADPDADAYFFEKTGQIVINLEVASEKQAISAVSHELLHKILKSEFANNPEMDVIVTEFKSILQGVTSEKINKETGKKMNVLELIESRLEYVDPKTGKRLYSEEYLAENKDEWLTAFSDAIAKKEVIFTDVDESAWTKMGKKIASVLQGLGWKKIGFTNGQEVFDFVKDYQKNIIEGKVTEKGKAGLTAGEVDTSTDVKKPTSKTPAITTAENNITKLEDDLTEGHIEYDLYESRLVKLEDALKKAEIAAENPVVVKAKPKQKQVQDVNIDSAELSSKKDKVEMKRISVKSKITLDKLGDIGMDNISQKEEKELYDIIKSMIPPKVRNFHTKNNSVVNLESIDGFEMANMVSETLSSIIPYIKNFNKGKQKTDPDWNDSLYGYLNAQLSNRMKGALRTGNVIKSEFTVGLDKAKDIAVEEGSGNTDVDKVKYRNLVESRVLDNDVLRSIKEKVLRTVRVLKSKMNAKVSLNKTVTPLIAEIKNSMGKQADIDIKKAMGGKKGNVYKGFLLKNKKAILENMTTTWLMGAIPETIEKSVGGHFVMDPKTGKKAVDQNGQTKFIPKWLKYPAWAGEKVDREKTSTENKGGTSGDRFVRRINNVNDAITDQEFLDHLIDAKGDPIPGKKPSLAKAMAEEISFDIFKQQIQSPDSEIRKAFEDNQKALGVVIAENIVEDLERQVDRGNVKLSVSMEVVSSEINWAIKETVRTEGSFNDIINTMSSETIEIAKSLELAKLFEGRKGRFKTDIKAHKWDKDTQALVDVYFKTITNSTQEISMKQLAKFSEALIDILPPQIVRELPANFFAISHSYLGAARTKKDVEGNVIPGAQGEFVWLDNIRLAKAAEPDWDMEARGVELLFDITKVRIFNANFEVMGRIGTILQKPWEKAEKKRVLKEKGLLDIVAGANANNKLLLDFVMQQATSVLAKDNSLIPGFLRFMESSDTKSLRGLTTLGLIEIIDGAQSLDESNPLWNDAGEFAIERSKEMYNRQDGRMSYKGKSYAMDKLQELITEKEFIDWRLSNTKVAHAGLLRQKGEHMEAASNIFVALTISAIEAVSDINKNPIAETQILTHLSLQNVATLVNYSQTLSTKLWSDKMDVLLGETSKLGNWRLWALDDHILENFFTIDGLSAQEYIDANFQYKEQIETLLEAIDIKKYAETLTEQEALNKGNNTKLSKTPKKIRIFDFDDTLAQTNSNVLYTMPDGTKGKIDPATFAKEAGNLEAQGVKWDFSEFSKVMEGKKGPLFEVAKIIADKRGTEDLFVLTARPQDAAGPIKEFLGSLGLNIPLKNITGLSNGAPSAKADWMVSKIAEGYNDFYFADDHMGNVKAVKDLLNTFDVKGKVQQARIKFSKSLDTEFNEMIARNKGVVAEAEFSRKVARDRGAKTGNWKFWMPTTLDDFKGLTSYVFAGKGRQGDLDQQFFQRALISPYFRGVAAIESAKQTMSNDFKGLNKIFKPVLKKLGKLIPDGDYTYDQAIRVALWVKAGYEVPGLSKRDQAKLLKVMANDAELSAYADGLLLISKSDKWIKPSEFWDTQTILSDLNNMTERGGRKEYIAEFIENADIIFSEKNLNKIQATYGTRQREALEDILYRMKNGTNRPSGTNKNVNRFNNWVNSSIGAIMFFNRRSAILQTLSIVNFVNWSDNNPAKAAAAFANQPQFWKDFATIFNSDKLKQRRAGLKGDVNEAEIASAVQSSTNKATAALSWLLKKGFLPTQMVDSFAIASGGATFYRNRINTLLGQGMTQEAAEAQAWLDFSEISEETQQSGDPALISSDQASVLGRMVLSFMNTPIQLNRSIKKSSLDLYHRRRTKGMSQAQSDFSNISKITYYGFIQTVIFTTLQNAMFALLPGFDDEEETDEAFNKKKEGKIVRMVSSMIDTTLKGGFGLPGAVISTVKNVIIEYNKQDDKGYQADHTYTILQAANLAPPIGSKLRKGYGAIQTNRFDGDVIKKRGYDVTLDGKFNLSPKYAVLGNAVEATTNLPLARVVDELNSLTEALDSRNTKWQQIALGLGWKTWDVGAKNEEHDLIKMEAKAERKEQGKVKAKKTRERKKEAEILRVKNLSTKELAEEAKVKSDNKNKRKIERDKLKGKTPPVTKPKVVTKSTPEQVLVKRKKVIKDMTKGEQVKILLKSGLTKGEIRKLQYETDRVEAIIKIRNKKKTAEQKLREQNN